MAMYDDNGNVPFYETNGKKVYVAETPLNNKSKKIEDFNNKQYKNRVGGYLIFLSLFILLGIVFLKYFI